MNVVVDTSVWSLALRRRAPRPSSHVAELAELIREGRALLLGVVRQELLSGIEERSDFERLRLSLRAFVDVPVVTGDHERAAEAFNACRSKVRTQTFSSVQ